MAELQNTFSWSYSRHGTFESCLRKYYLCYYGSWGGWDAAAAPSVREIYIQKKLTTLAMWLGTVVHGAAETALKGLLERRPWPLEKLVASTSKRAHWDVEDSERAAWRANPTRTTAFQEHYYAEPVDPSAWRQQLVEIERQVTALYGTPVYKRLVIVPQKLKEVENLVSIDIAGVPVWVKLDALVEDGAGGCVVIDWKTGAAHERESIATQLGIYGLYCQLQHGFPPDRITAMHVNLRTGTQEKHPIGAESLEASREFVRESASAMKRRLRDPTANVAHPDDFPMLPAGASTCRRCAFRRTCERESPPNDERT